MDSNSDLSFDVLMNEDDYIRDNFVTILPIVRDCIKKSENDEIVLRAIDISTGIFLQCFPVEEYEENIFKFACPAAESIFINTLKGIQNFKPDEIQTQSDLAQTYISLLNICIHIIESYQRAFQYLSEIKTLTVNNAKSLVESTVEILYKVYEHCRSSEQLYGDYFCKTTDTLTKLYKNATELQGLLLNLLTKQFQFNCEIEEDLEFLDKILIYLYKLSLLLMTLDVKSMAELWKAYAALNGRFSEVIKDRHNIGKPIRCLCDHLCQTLDDILLKEDEDKSMIVKNLKISCFLLKLVIKFCELFNGYIRECHSALVKLLVFLFRHNQSFLEFIKVPNEVITEFVKQISIGSEPLLAHLLSDKQMIREFSQVVVTLEKNSDMAFGFLLLCCSVMKKLILSDTETRKLWINENYNIVEWVFLSLNLCQGELISNIKFQSVLIPGKQKRFTDLYEYVLINLTSFILTSNSKDFPYVEVALLKNILQTNPWLALLAMDVWCVLARFANAELCCSQLTILSKMLIRFPAESWRPEKIYLTCLIQRIFPLMVQKDQDSFVKLFPVNENPHLWSVFDVHNLSPTYRVTLQSRLHQLIVDNIKKFRDYGNLFNFYNLEKSLLGISQEHKIENKEIAELILTLWKFDVSDSISKVFLKRYIKMLLGATCAAVRFLTPSNLQTILFKIREIILTFQNSSMQLYFIIILRQLTAISIPPDNSQQSTIKAIASTFNDLLTSDNLFVKQKSLEVFSHLAKVTKHTEIIRLSVGSNISLQSDVTNYLKRNVDQQNDSVATIKRLNIEYLHVCEEKEESYEPVAQKPKLDYEITPDRDFQEVINRVRKDANVLFECFDSLSNAQKREIKDIRDHFTSMIEKY